MIKLKREFLETYNSILLLPKTELHVHLEGAIPLPSLLHLINKYEVNSNIKSVEDLEKMFNYSNFANFIKTWMWKTKFINEYEDFVFIAEQFALSQIAQNIVYTEVFVSPGDHHKKGLCPQKILIAVEEGFAKYKDKITINIVVDLVRNLGEVAAMSMLDKLIELNLSNIVGIGIGGSEKEFPPKPFTEVYKKAREFGLKTSAHAGEAASAQSVIDAIKYLKVDRIGHGCSAVYSQEALKLLKQTNTAVECCLVSNICTKAVATLSEHPIKNFMSHGICVSVNTDDPQMFNTNLSLELTLLMQELNFDMERIFVLLQNSITMSWLDHSTKTQLTEDLLSHTLVT